jgi:hypothetical protein
MNPLVICGRERDDVDIASVGEVTSKDNINAAVAAGGSCWRAC